jgi:DNA-binding transcriptional LysR family regulator
VDLDTTLLRALVVLADELHFGRAAVRLGVTQQALSQRIRRLEGELGAVLVDRSDRRQVRLTAEGRATTARAQDVLEAVDRLHPGPEDGGRLRVDVMGDDLAPSEWVRRAVRTHGLLLDAVHRPATSTAEHLLRAGGADLTLGRCGAVPSPWPTGVHHRLLLLEPLAVLVPAEHPWARFEELPLSRLRGEHLSFPMAAAPLEWRSYVAELTAFAGLDLDTTGSTFGYRQWTEDVATGAAAPSLVGGAMRLPDPGARTVPLVDPTPVFPWSVLWRDDLPAHSLTAVLTGMGFTRPVPPPGASVWVPEADRAFTDPDRASGPGARLPTARPPGASGRPPRR